MRTIEVVAENSKPQSPKTLGDVLYTESRPTVDEREWVALVHSIAGGDEVALHGLLERAQRMVFTLILRITANRETSEEVTIDVFHDIWRGASRYDAAHGTVIAWIMNQARSRAIDRLRFEGRKKRDPSGEKRPAIEVAADPFDVLQLRQEAETLRTAIAALTPDERRAIEATFFGGCTYAEAAARLNQPLGTVKTRIRSGLQKLRQVLAVEP